MERVAIMCVSFSPSNYDGAFAISWWAGFRRRHMEMRKAAENGINISGGFAASLRPFDRGLAASHRSSAPEILLEAGAVYTPDFVRRTSSFSD
jgi:hypothetical protein